MLARWRFRGRYLEGGAMAQQRVARDGPTITQQQIENFLYRVANDDVYRYQLTTDPINTLAAVGIEIDENVIPAEGIVLPPSSVIMEHLRRIAEDFYSYACMPRQHHLIWTPSYINGLES